MHGRLWLDSFRSILSNKAVTNISTMYQPVGLCDTLSVLLEYFDHLVSQKQVKSGSGLLYGSSDYPGKR